VKVDDQDEMGREAIERRGGGRDDVDDDGAGGGRRPVMRDAAGRHNQ
jgi:hypothetical protein